MNDSVGVNRPQLAGGDIPRTLLVLAAWFFLAVWLGVTGKLVTTGGLPIGLGAAVVLPLLVFALDGRFGHPLFGGLMRLDLFGLSAEPIRVRRGYCGAEETGRDRRCSGDFDRFLGNGAGYCHAGAGKSGEQLFA